ncbi:hypothetical protein MMC07_000343 [Pseudocyphellaria aurata]|nr:hypothetical protein [Pseudocyphellaria aurata]
MLAISRLALGVLLSLVVVARASSARNSSVSYGAISTSVNGSVLRATVNNPPINLFDEKLSIDFLALINSLYNQTEIKVVILASANPDYWITHFDLSLFLRSRPPPPGVNTTVVRNRILYVDDSIATLPVIFIAEVNGRVSGSGGDLVTRCDIRYAGPGAKLSVLEVGFNALPGGGALQYLVKLIGRARALEYFLSGRTVDAETAAAIGWVNRAFSTAEELRDEVDALAQRIGSFSQPALGAIKGRINEASKPTTQSVAGDAAASGQLIARPECQAALARYLELSDDQSGNAFELGLTGNLEELNG